MIASIRRFFGVKDNVIVTVPAFAKWDPTYVVKTTSGKAITVNPPRSFYQAGTIRRFR